jgi:hypothetical protein
MCNNITEITVLINTDLAYLSSFFLEPKDINSKSLGAIWNFNKVIGLT